MNCIVLAAFAVFLAVPLSAASDLPDAPSRTAGGVTVNSAFTSAVIIPATVEPVAIKIVDKRFIGLAIVSSGATFADSYTTLFARQNWLAAKPHVCNVEAESPYLYGKHPTAARAYAVAAGKSLGSVAAAYYLRKHHHKWWSVPLATNAFLSLQGVAQNMMTCN